ncbi:MAG TPA: PorV/PorQ family protein [Vicingaceae bacterium]|nr:PorV/PorQ family protein [Vicingaceae bacterium]
MRKTKVSIVVTAIILSAATTMYAGNKDRAGEAGASQVLINPWTKSVGFGGANSASVVGLEAMGLNIAGMAFTNKTELLFTYKNYLSGSDININSFGFSQRVSETGVIGMSVMSMNFGDIDITTVDLPEGGIGTFSPSYLNLDFGYAQTFSNSISGGMSVKIISESISNVSNRGFAFDAGIRYKTGENDRMKFGIALKNVGPTMRPSGDGLSFTMEDMSTGSPITVSKNHRVADFQLPSLLNIGVSYDFYIAPSVDSVSKEISSMHRVTAAGNFTANSFGNDQYKFGVEYAFKEMFMVRGGYTIEQDTWFDSEKRITAFTGPAFGASVVAPLGKSGSTFSFDYAYQTTENFDGTHSIGVRLNM